MNSKLIYKNYVKQKNLFSAVVCGAMCNNNPNDFGCVFLRKFISL